MIIMSDKSEREKDSDESEREEKREETHHMDDR